MKNSLWKLAALAGVVGIVLLAFLQAQQGLETTDSSEFVPADIEEFAENEPDLGTAGELDAPPFDAVDPSGFAAVDDETPGAAGMPPEFELGRPDDVSLDAFPPAGPGEDDDPWSTQPSAEPRDPRGGTSGLSPIRRRRPVDGGVRTAAGFEEEPRIRRTAGTQVDPLPELEPIPESDDFGPDLFADDPPERSSEGRVPLPVPERFEEDFGRDTEVEPAGFGEDEFPSERESTPPKLPDFSDDFPPFEDEPAKDEEPAAEGADREPPSLEPLPLFDDDPAEEPSRPQPMNDGGAGEPDPLDFAPELDAPSLGEPESDPPSLGAPESYDTEPFETEEAEPAPERREPPSLETIPLTDDPPRSGPSIEFGDDTEPAEEPAPRPEPRRVPAETGTPIGREDLLGDGTIDATAPLAAQKPRLTIDKVAPETALLGQPLVYSIVVKNVGETPAREVVIHDRIPRGTELTGTIPRAEFVERSVDERTEKLLRWKLGTIEPGTTKTIRVRVVPVSEGQIGSVATVNFVAEVGARTRVTAPSLEFDLTGPSKARLGKPVVYQFSVRNNGRSTATGVVIRDLLPAGLTHPGGDDLEYSVGDLEPGDSKSIRLSLTAAQEGEVVNRAVVTADGGVKVEKSARVTIVGTDLVVSRTGPAKRYVGRAAVFTNVVANNGDVPLENVTIVEQLPKEIEFVEAAGGGQYNPAKHVIAWRVERLGPKESRVLKVKLRPKSPGRYTCTITAKSETGAEASTEAETQAIGYSALGLDVEGGGPPVFVGDTVTFTVTPKNRGTTNAANVVVDVEISPELELASVNAPTKYTRDGNKVRFTAMPTLGGGASAGYELTLRAVKPGEGRVRTSVVADDLTSPLEQDAAVRVVAETP